MYSIIKEVDKYIKDNNLDIKSFKVSYECFPMFLNQAILDEIRSVGGSYFDLGTSEYEFMYDEDNNLLLHIRSNNMRNNIIIASEKVDKFPNLLFRYNFRHEKDIIKKMYLEKYLYNGRIKIRNMINERFSDMENIDKTKLEYILMKDLIKEEIVKLDLNHENIFDKLNLEDELKVASKKIINEMMGRYYGIDLVKETERKRMDGISYIEPVCDKIVRKNTGNSNCQTKERVNSTISITERINTLESYDYLYREYAYNNDKNNIDYLSYLYHTDEFTYVLVMEPYSGEKYTKIAIINDAKEIIREEFVKYIRYYLELSYIDSMEDKTLVRCSHTTIDTFNRIMEYIMNGECDTLANSYFKKRVKDIKEQ